ncbi:DEAD/DEAH box helicase [Cupriavidus basilensis]|uniref:SWI/SNF family helicase n=1 Tax=Cupriavidus basilensis TaxID=68895 RepID=A0A0C4Y193_9BURK|nr:DEAD/DEAH box helicase [Cupriavidus basilensis]AJG18792.1 SWI/SNF family helicase [Cupriavidus basilensis]
MTGLEPHVAIRLKHIFPRIPKAQTDDFVFPNDQAHCADLDWFCSRYPLAMSDGDVVSLRGGRLEFEATQAELERILTPDYVPPAYLGLRPGQVVRPYQGQAVEVALRRKGLLLGDDLGLGKTYTAGAFMLKPGTLPAAVVVQTHLQVQWTEKLTAFTTLRVHKIKGTKPYDLPPADVYIFKYSQLLGWVDFLRTGYFKTVIYDEVQELRTGSASGKGSAAHVLSDNAEFRIGLSATPIYNYGTEIWNIMRAIDSAVLGPTGDFTREWTDGTGAMKDPEALGTYLREQHVFIRRTKRDVGQQVPPINRIVEIVDTDEKAMQDMAKLAQALALKVTTGSFTERGQAARELDLLARHTTGVAKARSVAAYVRILLDADVPVLLMGWHRDVYDTWLKDLAEFKPVMYTGSESPTQKEEAKRAFLAGETNLFIMSLRSGAGLDGLQHRCSTVVFGELDWSPKVHEQIIGRLDREGQEEQVTAIYLNSEDGSDPPMVDLLGLKASQSTAIVDPGRLFEAVHSDASRIKLLAQQFLGKKRAQPTPVTEPEFVLT